MALIDAFPAESGTVDAAELRRLLAGLVTRSAAGAVRAGVMTRTPGALLVTGKNSMAVDVGAFEAVLSRNGVQLVANDGVLTVALDAAPAANSRYDVIYVYQPTSALGDTGPFVPVLGVQKGTASATPSEAAVVAALPAGALALASVLIPSGATSTLSTSPLVVIAQIHPYTAAAGGVIHFRNQTEADSFAAPDGTPAWRLDWNAPDVRQRGTWGKGGTITLNTNWQQGDPPLTIRRTGKKVRIQGQVTNKTLLTANANAQVGIGDITDASLRPAGFRFGAVAINSTSQFAGQVIVFANGGIYFSINASVAMLAIGSFYLTFDLEYEVA